MPIAQPGRQPSFATHIDDEQSPATSDACLIADTGLVRALPLSPFAGLGVEARLPAELVAT